MYGWDVLDSLMTPLLIALLLVVILVLGLRWFKYKERMAALQRSAAAVEILLDDEPDARRKRQLAYGLTTALVGLALTIGLGTLGIGPWLLAGLVPFFVRFEHDPKLSRYPTRETWASRQKWYLNQQFCPKQKKRLNQRLSPQLWKKKRKKIKRTCRFNAALPLT